MTSTLKTEKIQFRGDNSDAITIASGGAIAVPSGISTFTHTTGGVVQEYELSGTNYRSHSFLNSGPHRFSTNTSLTNDFLIPALTGRTLCHTSD